jgi:MarR family transcriptional regulator for hemolysin
MERDGLIVRTASEEDKRQVRIYLTEQIRPTVAALQEKRDEVVARMTRNMSPVDLAELHRLLDQARTNLEHPETGQQMGE